MSSDADGKSGMADDSIYLAGRGGCLKIKNERQYKLVKATISSHKRTEYSPNRLKK